ncbi:hypothetical protein KPATCC21470_2170 [Kitasatospora purpeofusca]
MSAPSAVRPAGAGTGLGPSSSLSPSPSPSPTSPAPVPGPASATPSATDWAALVVEAADVTTAVLERAADADWSRRPTEATGPPGPPWTTSRWVYSATRAC